MSPLFYQLPKPVVKLFKIKELLQTMDKLLELLVNFGSLLHLKFGPLFNGVPQPHLLEHHIYRLSVLKIILDDLVLNRNRLNHIGHPI